MRANLQKHKAIIVAFLLCLLFTTVIFFANIYLFDSTLNGYHLGNGISFENLSNDYFSHIDHPVFKMRPLTTLLIYLLGKTGVGISVSYIIVLFVLLSLDGLMVYAVAGASGLQVKQRLLSIIVFYLTFSVLFAFTTTMHSYDEPLQYLLLFASLYYYLKQRYKLFALFIFLACVTRETSLLLIPGFIIFNYLSYKSIKKILPYLLDPALIFACYFVIFSRINSDWQRSVDYVMFERFNEWRYNIQNIQFAKESVIMIFMTIFPWLILAYEHVVNNGLKWKREYFWAFAASLIINTPIGFITARAQESRIFALPLVFFWPISGILFSGLYSSIKIKNIASAYRSIFAFLLAIYPSYWLAFDFYDPTFYGSARVVFQIYLFVCLMFIIFTELCKRTKILRLTLLYKNG